jgi:uncharacterized membrane protein YfcA
MIDAGLGMGYGTILSPVLILMGFPPQAVVPGILLSQALGGLMAAVWHHKYGNADLSIRGEDGRTANTIIVLGLAATVLAVLLGIKLPRDWVTSYIGALVTVMGIIILVHPGFVLARWRLAAVALLSAFNKGISGGGFGPVVTGGQIISGQRSRNAIGVTTLAEGPICIAGFVTYVVGMSGVQDRLLLVVLCAGALLGALIGPGITARYGDHRLARPLLGGLILALGLGTLAKVLLWG